MKIFLLSITSIIFGIFLIYYLIDLLKNKNKIKNSNVSKLKGFISGFFLMGALDTVGVGAFSTTTGFFNTTKYVKEHKCYPGTLNVANAIPSYIQTLVFLNAVVVDLKLVLVSSCFALLGGQVGPIILKRLRTNYVRFYLGIGLLISSLFILLDKLNIFNFLEKKATLTYLPPLKFIIFVLFVFIFSTIGSLGISAYALFIVLTNIIGLNPIMAWPIMSVSAVCKATSSSINYIKNDLYKRPQTLYITTGSIFGVLSAAFFIIKYQQYISIIIWVALGFIIYTGFDMLYTAIKKNK